MALKGENGSYTSQFQRCSSNVVDAKFQRTTTFKLQDISQTLSTTIDLSVKADRIISSLLLFITW